jgi:hypothetical protein
VVWDPSGQGRVKLYGSAGVFFAKIPNNVAMTLLGTGGRVRRADYFDPGLTDPVPEGVEALGTTRHLTLAATEPAEVDLGRADLCQELSLGADFAVSATSPSASASSTATCAGRGRPPRPCVLPEG